MSSSSYVVRVAEDPADREACFAVRKEVFVVEQGVPQDIEYDAYDAHAVHVLAVRDDGVPLGAGRLLHGEVAAAKTGGEAGVGSLGRLAVVEAARGLGIGIALGAGHRGRGTRAWARGGGPARADARAGVLRAAGVCGVRAGVPRCRDRAPGDAAGSLGFRLRKWSRPHALQGRSVPGVGRLTRRVHGVLVFSGTLEVWPVLIV